MKILAATNNKHKIGEFRNILKDTGVEIISQEELGKQLPDIPEDGKTFEENAGIKALGFAKFADMTVIADDSGLEIRALDGAPGIYSARYAETNEKRIERVLRELEEVNRRIGETANRSLNSENSYKIGNWQSAIENLKTDNERLATSDFNDRAARFVCVIALASPEKVIATFRGEVYGRIGYEPKGCGGFGYDPVFIPDGYDRTFAELGSDIKDKISHRANALKKLDEYLKL
ncbi:MAG: non-canonical purine NTP pyrophosphatase [Victivallales bacterium]